jgi:hypothetical protein
MAQGAIKTKKPSAATGKSSGGRHGVLGPKKGARTIAPKKQVLVKKQKMLKVRILSYFFVLSSGEYMGLSWET